MNIDVPDGRVTMTKGGDLVVEWAGRTVYRAIFEIDETGAKAQLKMIIYNDGENWVEMVPEIDDIPNPYRGILESQGYTLLPPKRED